MQAFSSSPRCHSRHQLPPLPPPSHRQQPAARRHARRIARAAAVIAAAAADAGGAHLSLAADVAATSAAFKVRRGQPALSKRAAVATTLATTSAINPACIMEPAVHQGCYFHFYRLPLCTIPADAASGDGAGVPGHGAGGGAPRRLFGAGAAHPSGAGAQHARHGARARRATAGIPAGPGARGGRGEAGSDGHEGEDEAGIGREAHSPVGLPLGFGALCPAMHA